MRGHCRERLHSKTTKSDFRTFQAWWWCLERVFRAAECEDVTCVETSTSRINSRSSAATIALSVLFRGFFFHLEGVHGYVDMLGGG